MKNIYLIRHGQSEGNAGSIRQGPITPLTDHGKAQAKFMAERCAKLPIEVLITSTMKRAHETAAIIAEKTGKRLEVSDLFRERRRPTEFIGKSHQDPEGQEMDRLLVENFTTPGYRYSDEENFEDVKSRAQAALAFLVARDEEHVGVVTHSLFARVLLATAVLGDELTAVECDRFIKAFDMENTGLTVLKYTSTATLYTPEWKVWTWNDHAHLG